MLLQHGKNVRDVREIMIEQEKWILKSKNNENGLPYPQQRVERGGGRGAAC